MLERDLILEINTKINKTKKAKNTKEGLIYVFRKYASKEYTEEIEENSMQLFIDELENSGYLKQSTIITYSKRLEYVHFLVHRRKINLDTYKFNQEYQGAPIIPVDILDDFVLNSAPLQGVKFFNTLLFLRGSGCRVSEIRHIKKEDVFISNGKIYFKVFSSKNSILRTVFIPNKDIAEHIYRYAVGFPDSKSVLFCRPNTVKTLLTRMNRLLPNGYKISSHSFRKVLIMELFNNNYNLQDIMNITGHKSLESLSRYAKMNSSNIVMSNTLNYFMD